MLPTSATETSHVFFLAVAIKIRPIKTRPHVKIWIVLNSRVLPKVSKANVNRCAQHVNSRYLLYTTTSRRIISSRSLLLLVTVVINVQDLIPPLFPTFFSHIVALLLHSWHVFLPGMKCSASDKFLLQLLQTFFVTGSGTIQSGPSMASKKAASMAGRLSSSSMLSNQ